MHPIERLRALARADWLDPHTIAVEAADAIGDAARHLGEPTAVSIARRLLAWHSACGPLWFVAGRILSALDPAAAAVDVIEELTADPTLLMLDAALPDGAVPLVVGDASGLAGIAGETGLWLGDGQPTAFGPHPAPTGLVSPASPHQVRAVVERASHVLIGAHALGPDGAAARAPAGVVATAARASDTPTWLVAGLGTAVDASLWNRIRTLLESGGGRPVVQARVDVWWDDTSSQTRGLLDVVDTGAVSFVCGPTGLVRPPEAAAQAAATPTDLLDCAGADAF
ncbi:MAG: hypothetical protein IT198_12795 [Acidimicrobiia bacterium]|nr:hypothetical protein [Acidimicrobiia bacterium]